MVYSDHPEMNRMPAWTLTIYFYLIYAGIYIFLFCLGFITLSACLYAEKRIQRTWYDENKRINYTYGHGWCLLVAWVCSVIPFILVGGIILVICFLKKA